MILMDQLTPFALLTSQKKDIQYKKCTNVLPVIWLTLVTAFVRFASIPAMRGVMCLYMQIEEILMVLEEVFVIVGLKVQRAKEFARNLKKNPQEFVKSWKKNLKLKTSQH